MAGSWPILSSRKGREEHGSSQVADYKSWTASGQDAQAAKQRLRSFGSPQQAAILARFFKTGPGEYGEGDRFIGVKVPVIRKVAREFKGLPLAEVECLLHSEIHEERLLALVILVGQFEKGDDATGSGSTTSTSPTPGTSTTGTWWTSRPRRSSAATWRSRSRKPLYRLAKSASLWERRIAILATFHFIRHGDFADTLRIAEMLLDDKEDLIHKAVGWMLREVGKRDVAVLEAFLAITAERCPGPCSGTPSSDSRRRSGGSTWTGGFEQKKVTAEHPVNPADYRHELHWTNGSRNTAVCCCNVRNH